MLPFRPLTGAVPVKWLIGIAAVMLIAHYFWRRAERQSGAAERQSRAIERQSGRDEPPGGD